MPDSPQEFYEEMAVNGKNAALGARGERRARLYLRLRGYKILARNYKNPFGEVDIVAKKGDVIAFIEVKTRLSDSYGAPSQAVNGARKRRYALAAEYYFAGKEPDCTVRFDVIEIFRGKINHIENAFYR